MNDARYCLVTLGTPIDPMYETTPSRESEPNPATMNLETEMRDGTVIVHVHEPRIDADNSAELKDRLHELLDNTGRLVIELSQVRFIDSSGLGVLLSAYKKQAARKARLALASLQPQVDSMFHLTRLHRVFDIYPDLEEALQKG